MGVGTGGLYAVESEDGTRVLVSDIFLGTNLKAVSEIDQMSLNEDGDDLDSEDPEEILGQILEGHTPTLLIYPKREWAEAAAGFYAEDGEKLVVRELRRVEEAES